MKLTTAPALAYPDYSKPFILDTDTSDFGISALLSQKNDKGRKRVVALASQWLSKAEHRYCVTRRELLAIVVFTQHFRPYMYLLGREFTLCTDHSLLTWLQSFRDPEGQLARWLEKLQQFLFRQWEGPNGSRMVYQLVMPKSKCEDILRDYMKELLDAILEKPRYLPN